MTTPIVWKARLVRSESAGNRLLCGRQVAGRYVCQGEIAIVLAIPSDSGILPVATLPPGMTEDPPGSHFWRLTTNAQRRQAEGRNPLRSVRHRYATETSRGVIRPIDKSMSEAFTENLPTPWRRSCPHCRALAEVTDDMLV